MGFLYLPVNLLSLMSMVSLNRICISAFLKRKIYTKLRICRWFKTAGAGADQQNSGEITWRFRRQKTS